MSEFGGLCKHENNQHALVTPEDGNVAAQVAEKLKTVIYATPPMEERRKKTPLHFVSRLSYCVKI